MKITLNMEDLTIGDMELFENATGESLLETLTPQPVIDKKTGRAVPDPDDPKGRPLTEIKTGAKAFIGLIYIALHRDDPSVTPEFVRSMKMADLELDLAGAVEEPDDAPDPTTDDPAPEANASD